MTPNFSPEQVIHQKIKLSTIRIEDGVNVAESHSVDWVPVTFNLPLNAILLPTSTQQGYIKYVVPLTNSNGRYFIKIHFPKNSSDMYITYAEKNSEMADGYWDYRTLVKEDFIKDFRTFIRDNRPNLPKNYPYSKVLKFSAYGDETNQPSIAVQFSVEFKSLTGGIIAVPVEYNLNK